MSTETTAGGDPTDEAVWEIVGLLTGSRQREVVVESLSDEGPATPSTLAERTGLAITHVSRVLSDLREVDAVELLVPEDTHKGRIYGLTDAGAQGAEKASEVDA